MSAPSDPSDNANQPTPLMNQNETAVPAIEEQEPTQTNSLEKKEALATNLHILQNALTVLEPFARLAGVFDVEPYNQNYPDSLRVNGTGKNFQADVLRANCFLTLGDCRRARTVFQTIELLLSEHATKSEAASGSPKSQGRCETTMTERFDVGGCDCPTFELGPCAEFEAGSNGRCVYCDHREACHAKVSAPLSATTQAEGGPPPCALCSKPPHPDSCGHSYRPLEEPRAAIEPRSREGQMEREEMEFADFHRDCFVTPWVDRKTYEFRWYNGVGRIVDVKGCILVPREADIDGTCILYRSNATPPPTMEGTKP